ncbi:hypothetical protein NKH99_32420 [Mesorhizobium sp. M0854]|uniref:hypothetical protein n=1 Tax=Mesorhizobium sp. M0854 TaxID=2957013 RepID=UPI00333AE81B
MGRFAFDPAPSLQFETIAPLIVSAGACSAAISEFATQLFGLLAATCMRNSEALAFNSVT